jgi:hypothetical protein
MVDSHFRKVTLSIPPQLVDDLDYISGRVGISRSALITSLMSEPAHDLRGLVESVPENPTPEEVVRLRGKSRALVEERVSGLLRMSDDLFS